MFLPVSVGSATWERWSFETEVPTDWRSEDLYATCGLYQPATGKFLSIMEGHPVQWPPEGEFAGVNDETLGQLKAETSGDRAVCFGAMPESRYLGCAPDYGADWDGGMMAVLSMKACDAERPSSVRVSLSFYMIAGQAGILSVGTDVLKREFVKLGLLKPIA